MILSQWRQIWFSRTRKIYLGRLYRNGYLFHIVKITKPEKSNTFLYFRKRLDFLITILIQHHSQQDCTATPHVDWRGWTQPAGASTVLPWLAPHQLGCCHYCYCSYMLLVWGALRHHNVTSLPHRRREDKDRCAQVLQGEEGRSELAGRR